MIEYLDLYNLNLYYEKKNFIFIFFIFIIKFLKTNG